MQLFFVLFSFATLFATNVDSSKASRQLRGGTSFEVPVSSNCIVDLSSEMIFSKLNLLRCYFSF